MGMEMSPETLPDTYGLPEYKVTQIKGEIIGGGHDVRLVCGSERFGNINWLYTVVAAPEDLLLFARYCEQLACEAFNIYQMTSELRASGRH